MNKNIDFCLSMKKEKYFLDKVRQEYIMNYILCWKENDTRHYIMTQQLKTQAVRFDGETVQIETVLIRGIECLRLEDVQRRFLSVTVLCIDDVQLAFITDECGKNLEPLHIKAYKHQVIQAVAPPATVDTNVIRLLSRLKTV